MRDGIVTIMRKSQKQNKIVFDPLDVETTTEHEPWKNIPIEIIIEYNRKKEKRQEDKRKRLYVPIEDISGFSEVPEDRESNDYKIVIKL